MESSVSTPILCDLKAATKTSPCAPGKGRGGRRYSYIGRSEEAALLRRVAEQQAPSQLIETSEVQKAYEAAVGHPVAASTVYRMLRRHGWRRVVTGSVMVPRNVWAMSNLGPSE